MLFSFFPFLVLPPSDCNTNISQSAAVALTNIWLMVKYSSTRCDWWKKRRRARSSSLIISRWIPRISRVRANRTVGAKFPHRRRGSGESSMESLCVVRRDESAVRHHCLQWGRKQSSSSSKEEIKIQRSHIYLSRERDVCSILLVSDPWRVYSLWV